MEFVGRERELGLLAARLDRVRETGQASFLAMRGRRRVGKSRLAEEFAQASGSAYVYYTATQQGGGTELARFVDAVEASAVPRAADIRAGLRPESWEAALALAAEGASRERPLILVIDEFPYLVVGGFPVLTTEWGAGRDLAGYLRDALTDPTSFLVVSCERTLSAEFPAPAPRAVLAAIGAGARAHSAILAHTGLSATTVNETLDALRGHDVVRRLTPYSTRASTRTVLWEICLLYTSDAADD